VEQLIELDVMLLNFLLGVVMPLVTAALTKITASPGLKSTFNLVASLVAGSLGYLIAHDGRTTWYELLTYAFTTYLASGVSYQNLWRPNGVAPAIQVKTRNVGVGGHPTYPDA
jgi:hypothetical protein